MVCTEGCFGRSEDRDVWLQQACPVETTTDNCYHLGMVDRAKKVYVGSQPLYSIFPIVLCILDMNSRAVPTQLDFLFSFSVF